MVNVGQSLRTAGAPGGLSGGGGGGVRTLNSYPNPHFDLSSQEVPLTVKELFRHCLYLYLSHSEIAPIINKKCSYIITDLIYDTRSDRDKAAWKEVLEDILNVREFEYEMLLDQEIFGNSFCSLYYPFERNLVCKKCEKETSITNPDLVWHYREHKFVGTCPHCKQSTGFDVNDRQVKHKKRLKLIRWFPEYMQILQNPITGKSDHIYKIPKWLRTGVKKSEKDQNKYLVEDMPMVFLQAIKKGEDVKLDPETFYHMRVPGPSYYDTSFAIPPMLCVFKDAWLFQTYRRAQEAIAMEHVLPLRMLVPRPISGDHSPHLHNDLGQWSYRMQSMISRWRRDPNAVFTAPFPCEVVNIGGDAQALQVHNDMLQIRQQISVGLDFPPTLAFGDMNFSGSSITLRMLENTFLTRIAQLERFLTGFVVPKVQAWLGLPPIEIKHRDFKMADDAQQKQIALSLRQTNTLSDQTVISELGFNYADELKRKRAEEEDRNSAMMRQMVTQAEAQGKAQMISAKFEAQAQLEQQRVAQEAERKQQLDQYDEVQGKGTTGKMQELAEAAKNPHPSKLGGSNIEMSANMLDMLAESSIKATPPEQMDDVLLRTSKSNPQLAVAIRKRMQSSQSAANSVRPLPAQKPPRSPNAGI